VAGSFVDSPAISRGIDTTALPGTITAVAINDDASFAAAAVSGLEDESQGPQVLVFDLRSDAPPRVVMSSSASGLAFSPDGKDLAVVDVKTHSLSLVRDVAGDAAVTNVAGDGSGLSMPTAVAFVDATSVLISDRSGLVQLVNLGTNELKSIACYCKPDTVEPMTLKSTYRLTGLQTGAMWILNLTDSEATLRFVPVDSGDADGGESGNEQ
jgi:hypothetical protein